MTIITEAEAALKTVKVSTTALLCAACVIGGVGLAEAYEHSFKFDFLFVHVEGLGPRLADRIAAEKAATAVLKPKEQAISDAADTHDAAATAAIQTQYRTLTQEVTKYVPIQTDADCVIPNSAVSLLNAGVSGQLPPAAGVPDASPSPFHLSDLAVNALANDEAKRLNDQQLTDLQAWVVKMHALAPPP